MKEYINYIKAIYRFHKERIPYKKLYDYIKQWRKYVVKQSPHITISPFTFKQFYEIIQHYKKECEVPNVIYSDGNIIVGKVNNKKILKCLPYKHSWLKIYKEIKDKDINPFYIIKTKDIGTYMLIIDEQAHLWTYYDINGNICTPPIEIPDNAYEYIKNAEIIQTSIFEEMIKQYFKRKGL